jgi:hypothetical protein
VENIWVTLRTYEGNQEWRIVFKDSIKSDGEECDGLTIFDERMILIRRQVDRPWKMILTLWHEIGHVSFSEHKESAIERLDFNAQQTVPKLAYQLGLADIEAFLFEDE